MDIGQPGELRTSGLQRGQLLRFWVRQRLLAPTRVWLGLTPCSVEARQRLGL